MDTSLLNALGQDVQPPLEFSHVFNGVIGSCDHAHGSELDGDPAALGCRLNSTALGGDDDSVSQRLVLRRRVCLKFDQSSRFFCPAFLIADRMLLDWRRVRPLPYRLSLTRRAPHFVISGQCCKILKISS